MDPEMLGLTYIKGASTDSGIDTNPCMAPGVRVLMQGRAGEQGHPWASGHHDDGASEEDHGKLYLPQGYASPILSSQVTEGSIGDLSEISSHSRYGAAIPRRRCLLLTSTFKGARKKDSRTIKGAVATNARDSRKKRSNPRGGKSQQALEVVTARFLSARGSDQSRSLEPSFLFASEQIPGVSLAR